MRQNLTNVRETQLDKVDNFYVVGSTTKEGLLEGRSNVKIDIKKAFTEGMEAAYNTGYGEGYDEGYDRGQEDAEGGGGGGGELPIVGMADALTFRYYWDHQTISGGGETERTPDGFLVITSIASAGEGSASDRLDILKSVSAEGYPNSYYLPELAEPNSTILSIEAYSYTDMNEMTISDFVYDSSGGIEYRNIFPLYNDGKIGSSDAGGLRISFVEICSTGEIVEDNAINISSNEEFIKCEDVAEQLDGALVNDFFRILV